MAARATIPVQAALIATFLAALHAVHAQEVVSIGGFVTVASTFGSSNADLSAVRIRLLDPNGVKRSEGDCSPNGYYFVPVDPGNYTVKASAAAAAKALTQAQHKGSAQHVQAHPGWLFTPSEVQITCDHQQCNNGDDVNFQLTGLQLSGHVEPGLVSASCKAAAAKYDGITVTARPAGVDGAATIAGKAVVRDSSFSLGPLLPGSYVLTATHPEWDIQPARITHRVDVDSTKISTPFQVAGYHVSGTVTSKSGPVAGIQVTLLSTDLSTIGCSKSHPPGSVSAADIETALSTTALCSVLTDANGRYSFSGVPCGQYTLQAQHPDPSSTFEIQPASLVVVVGQGNAEVSEQFVVTGFSVTGRVVDVGGNGVAGVSIHIAGEERASTDLNGRYVIQQMHEGRVHLTASRKHYTFSSLQAVHITPTAQALPDMLVTSLAVCGLLSSGDARFKVNNRRVSLTSTDGDDTAVAQHATTDAHGSFCFMVPAGRYRVAPHVSSDEKSKGLIFSPSYTDLEVTGQPVLHLTFSQAQLTMSGTVVCLNGSCPGDVQLTLKDAAGKVVYAARLAEVAVGDKRATGSTVGFQLPRISPGRYKLAASKLGWCWENENGVDVVVEANDVEAPPLKQSGYQLQVVSSHFTELQITGSSVKSPIAVEAPEGRSTVCLPSSATFEVAAGGCYLYAAEKFVVDVRPSAVVPDTLTLNAIQVQIAGEIKVLKPISSKQQLTTESGSSDEPSKHQAADAYPPYIMVTSGITGSDAAIGVVTKAVPLNPIDELPSPFRVYSYRLPVDLGSTVVITPSVSEAYGLLFYPRSLVVKHDAVDKGCSAKAGVIEARPGVVVSGTTDPAVPGAEIKVLYKTSSAAAGHSAGSLAAEGTTDSSGAFAIGTLPDDCSYSVQISKPGYVFTTAASSAIPADGVEVQPTGAGQLSVLQFISKQLAQVSVTVKLPLGADPSGVFLSLSGSGGFKNNARLGSDSTLTFYDLGPGVYWLKPLLREHQFNPPVAEMQLADGQAVAVGLTAVRTAWGISGAVTSISGRPLAGAVVEACQGSGAAAIVLDSSVTDESGHYRVGNLSPEAAYEVRVKLDGRVTSAHPAAVKVDLTRQDVTGIDFIAARTSSSSTLSAALKLPLHMQTAIRAELRPAAAGSSSSAAGGVATAAVAVDASGFFEIRGLKPGSYKLRLSCDAAAADGLFCKPFEMPVQVPPKDIHLGILPFSPVTAYSTVSTAAANMHLSDEGLDQKLPVLVLICLVACGFTVFKQAISDILQLKANTIPSSTSSSGSSSSGVIGTRRTAAAALAGGVRSNWPGLTSKNRATATDNNRGAAVAAAAAVGLDDDEDDEAAAVRQPNGHGPGVRSRSRRA